MKATWNLADGREITLDVAEGTSLMEAATRHGVPGIIGECGGSMSCATCHVVVDSAWADRAGGPSPFEEDMLDITEAGRQPSSRLSCQLKMNASLDGIVVSVPQA
ncbi:2Fe-2S iron-sulfur cluster-binding protein [Tabrizicola sp.]|mgnify:CR=1 FL=1|jgi:2Fe-2S ferredoxin|uniref:2Fe-2S iron-sulfur cluster-binding protein n=1 Tax=Tabrizicola sp. TaxID=2005166 RepID=UPI001A52872B|nr:2Fe-2S iron-sulfur cluster-binding protein [Tabrizicola sp.]MBL9062857.1 (2Fe-2S)-binding protein [Tabrizicola sp.]